MEMIRIASRVVRGRLSAQLDAAVHRNFQFALEAALLTSKQQIAATVSANSTARNIDAPATWNFPEENNHEVYSGTVVVREGEK